MSLDKSVQNYADYYEQMILEGKKTWKYRLEPPSKGGERRERDLKHKKDKRTGVSLVLLATHRQLPSVSCQEERETGVDRTLPWQKDKSCALGLPSATAPPIPPIFG